MKSVAVTERCLQCNRKALPNEEFCRPCRDRLDAQRRESRNKKMVNEEKEPTDHGARSERQGPRPMPAHVLEFIDEELTARGWSRRDLAERMGGEPNHEELALQLLELRDPDVFLGEESARALGRAFGTGPEIWANLDSTWRDAIKARIQEHGNELYIALRMIFWSYEDDCGCECDGPTCCKAVKEQCAKCEARAAITLIEDVYAGASALSALVDGPQTTEKLEG
jgi:plasmid maintenance system antidote protein VapI